MYKQKFNKFYEGKLGSVNFFVKLDIKIIFKVII